MATILKSKMYRPENNLFTNGEVIDGKEQWFYIAKLEADNINQMIKGTFLDLRKESDEEFTVVASLKGPYDFYQISNGKPVVDENGKFIYVTDENGIVYEDVVTGVDEEGNDVIESLPVKQLNGYDYNFGNFGAPIASAMAGSIKKYKGDHPQP